MSQSDKKQTDKTKDQLMDSLRKSKNAGSSPTATADSGASEKGGETPSSSTAIPQSTGGDYARGGLRWPD